MLLFLTKIFLVDCISDSESSSALSSTSSSSTLVPKKSFNVYARYTRNNSSGRLSIEELGFVQWRIDDDVQSYYYKAPDSVYKDFDTLQIVIEGVKNNDSGVELLKIRFTDNISVSCESNFEFVLDLKRSAREFLFKISEIKNFKLCDKEKENGNIFLRIKSPFIQNYNEKEICLNDSESIKVIFENDADNSEYEKKIIKKLITNIDKMLNVEINDGRNDFDELSRVVVSNDLRKDLRTRCSELNVDRYELYKTGRILPGDDCINGNDRCRSPYIANEPLRQKLVTTTVNINEKRFFEVLLTNQERALIRCRCIDMEDCGREYKDGKRKYKVKYDLSCRDPICRKIREIACKKQPRRKQRREIDEDGNELIFADNEENKDFRPNSFENDEFIFGSDRRNQNEQYIYPEENIDLSNNRQSTRENFEPVILDNEINSKNLEYQGIYPENLYNQGIYPKNYFPENCYNQTQRYPANYDNNYPENITGQARNTYDNLPNSFNSQFSNLHNYAPNYNEQSKTRFNDYNIEDPNFYSENLPYNQNLNYGPNGSASFNNEINRTDDQNNILKNNIRSENLLNDSNLANSNNLKKQIKKRSRKYIFLNYLANLFKTGLICQLGFDNYGKNKNVLDAKIGKFIDFYKEKPDQGFLKYFLESLIFNNLNEIYPEHKTLRIVDKNSYKDKIYDLEKGKFYMEKAPKEFKNILKILKVTPEEVLQPVLGYFGLNQNLQAGININKEQLLGNNKENLAGETNIENSTLAGQYVNTPPQSQKNNIPKKIKSNVSFSKKNNAANTGTLNNQANFNQQNTVENVNIPPSTFMQSNAMQNNQQRKQAVSILPVATNLATQPMTFKPIQPETGEIIETEGEKEEEIEEEEIVEEASEIGSTDESTDNIQTKKQVVQPKKKKISSGAIVAISVSVVAVIIVIASAGYYFLM
ncbi:hypothetical protein GVAV_000126 [Gurleya vavrai]